MNHDYFGIFTFAILVCLLSLPLVFLIYAIIKPNIKIKSNITKNVIIPISLFLAIFIIMLDLLSRPTIINKYIFDCYIQNKNCNNTCIVVKNEKNEYTIKNIPTEKIIFKKGNKNRLEIITCDSFLNSFKLFNEKYKSCREKGYYEGENYILYLKNNTHFFNKEI